ncbi:DNA damage-inducible transcript 4-like protein [Acipenser ruthenus]|uniref:DNA damage-inducible transcript 4-like protein n=1 Tax=Acipenser ruthenus TaxID=7906 RepID=A0A444V2C3_ACIRT|nr:DNA damage-inducible transcript 4-like protein [Acipenser ruthenus]
MVYSQALGITYGMGSLSDEDSLAELMKRLVHRFTAARKNSESPFERACETESTDRSDEEWFTCSTERGCMYLEELMEETAWLELAKQIELCLSAAKKCRLQCQELLIPTHLSRRIARDIVGMAASEPCGLRGAVIHLSLDIDGVCTPLGKIAQDSSAPPTFELTLVLKADKSKCFSFSHFFNVGTYLPPGANKVLKLSAGFRLVKRKLYSSDVPVIQDFRTA